MSINKLIESIDENGADATSQIDSLKIFAFPSAIMVFLFSVG
jgi:hypothetical protein